MADNPRTRLAFLATMLALCGSVGVALGQGGTLLDLEDITARSGAQQDSAEALVADALTRAEATRNEAAAVARTGETTLRLTAHPSNVTKGTGPVDLDAMVAGAQEAQAGSRSGPMLVAFASLSMPQDSLRRLIGDVTAAGGVVVFRGFLAGNPARFALAMQQLVARDQAASVLIDPRLFRAFAVDAVPTWVAVQSDYTPCDSLTCVSAVPAYDRISGNITTRYALEAIVAAKGAGAPVARVGIASLDRAR